MHPLWQTRTWKERRQFATSCADGRIYDHTQECLFLAVFITGRLQLPGKSKPSCLLIMVLRHFILHRRHCLQQQYYNINSFLSQKIHIHTYIHRYYKVSYIVFSISLHLFSYLVHHEQGQERTCVKRSATQSRANGQVQRRWAQLGLSLSGGGATNCPGSGFPSINALAGYRCLRLRG